MHLVFKSYSSSGYLYIFNETCLSLFHHFCLLWVTLCVCLARYQCMYPLLLQHLQDLNFMILVDAFQLGMFCVSLSQYTLFLSFSSFLVVCTDLSLQCPNCLEAKQITAANSCSCDRGWLRSPAFMGLFKDCFAHPVNSVLIVYSFLCCVSQHFWEIVNFSYV